MVLEQLSLASGDGGRQPSGDDGGKAARLPRWTRQEILVLVQGKRMVEDRVRKGRGSGLTSGSGQIEPKWASISSYCKRHGVNRGPVQCRKRWSNLAGDFKKIREWEVNITEETESFWVMRNDVRREKKLPGFFDREVYDILDGGGGGGGGGGEGELALALAPANAAAAAIELGDEEAEALFDSGRSAVADDGLFSDFEQPGRDDDSRSPVRSKETPVSEARAPIPVSVAEKQHQSFPSQESPDQGTNHEKQPAPEPEVQSTREGGRKRKRSTTDGEEETTNLEQQLIEALENNGKLLSSQLESQNTNLQLDRAQRDNHVNSLMTVLDKIADALGKIADKL